MTSRTALPADPFHAPERALPAQTRLDEYEIEQVLAQSNFAVVYRAYDHSLRLHVAIKEYLPDALALRSAETQVVLRARGHADRFEQGLQAFIGEAQTLARCDHPSLLRILRVLQRHGTVYRVMRYTPGPTLLEHRRSLGTAPDGAVMRGWLDALLGALEALHEEGCAHAAVAPGNILLLPGGRPLLLDFDAVRAALISDRTQSIMAALEPCFQPPEQQAAGAEQAMGPWTDLYSLAATMHFCISGQLPPPPGGPITTFEPLNEAWRRLRESRPGLGDAPLWLQVLDDCLAERARDRPQSVAEVRRWLDRPQAQPVSVSASVPPQASAAAATAQPGVQPAAPIAGATLPAVPAGPPKAPAPGVPAAATAPAKAAAASRVAPPAAVQRPAASRAPGVSTSPTVEALSALLTGKAPPPAAVGPVPSAAPAPVAALAPMAPMAPVARPLAVVAPRATENVPARKVIADLDQTLAAIAAQATADAARSSAGVDVAAADGDDAESAPMRRRRLLWLVAGAALLLTALAAAVVWLLNQYDPGLLRGPRLGVGGNAAASPAPPADMAAAAAPLLYPPPGAGPAVPMQPTPVTPMPAAQTPDTPARPKTPAAAAVKPAAPGSPRQACGNRERYALLQCMETQCAKKTWSKHEQCERLRKERKL